MNNIKKLKENRYSFPHWRTIASTYPEAVQIRLDEIKATRPFYNWREGQIDGDHIRERAEKKLGIEKCTTKNITTLTVDMGKKFQGLSVNHARKKFGADEFGLGMYEVLCILLASPEFLQTWEDGGIDCPGDEFDDPVASDRFDRAACLDVSGGVFRLSTKHCSGAVPEFGSASAFLPQSNLDAGSLESIEPSSLELALKIVVDSGEYVIFKKI